MAVIAVIAEVIVNIGIPMSRVPGQPEQTRDQLLLEPALSCTAFLGNASLVAAMMEGSPGDAADISALGRKPLT